MELPDDGLSHIRDFSRPMTRPDWRDLHRMTAYRFHRAILISYNERLTRPRVIYTFVARYCRCPGTYIYLFDYLHKPVVFLRLKSSFEN